MYNSFNPSFPYTVVCPSAPFENTIFKTLDECWGLCLGLSEESTDTLPYTTVSA